MPQYLVVNNEVAKTPEQGEIMVVLKYTWQRHETPKAVKVMRVTTQPTLHSIEKTDNA